MLEFSKKLEGEVTRNLHFYSTYSDFQTGQHYEAGLIKAQKRQKKFPYFGLVLIQFCADLPSKNKREKTDDIELAFDKFNVERRSFWRRRKAKRIDQWRRTSRQLKNSF